MRAVLFDFMGVLAVYPRGSSDAEFKEIFGLNLDVYEIHKIRKPVYRKLSRGEINRRKFWSIIFKKFGKRNNAEEIFLNCIKFKESGIPEILERIRKKYKLAVVSNNTDYWVRVWLKKLKIFRFFDAIVVSSKVKSRKPDKKIYLETCRRLKTKPKDSYYIGDEDEDIDGARKVGMKTIFIPWKSKHADADFKIKNLKELLKILNC